jgi:serine/threonine protein kinase
MHVRGSQLESGFVIAGYRIDELISRGGMGVVYRVTNVALNRIYALKVLAPELAGDEAFRERFKREMRIAASIRHPNVVGIHYAGEDDGLLFFVMDFVYGTDLREMLRKSGAVEPGRAVELLVQFAAALDAAHARGLVHRDVKPANILITVQDGEEHAYLTDFGVAKRFDTVAGLTAQGAVVGTVDYMSPEQITGSHIDARTDIYALGCVFFQMLTGKVPYDHENSVAKLFAHVHEPPPPLEGSLADLYPTFGQVLEKAMAKHPADRYLSAGDFARDAAAALRGARYTGPPTVVGVGDATPAPASAPPASEPQRPVEPHPPLDPRDAELDRTLPPSAYPEPSIPTPPPSVPAAAASMPESEAIAPAAPAESEAIAPAAPAESEAIAPAAPAESEVIAPAAVGSSSSSEAPAATPPLSPPVPPRTPSPPTQPPVTPPPTGAGPSSSPSGSSRRPWLIVAALLAVIGVVAAAVIVISGGSSKSTPKPGFSSSEQPVPTNQVTGAGAATVALSGDTATVSVDTNGLLNGSPHAMHIHAGGKGMCPPASASHLHHGHPSISTTDGIKFYGHPQVSLTTTGDTSSRSIVDFSRYPTVGSIRYTRTIQLPPGVAAAVRAGNAVVIVHGIDYNHNGIYDNVLDRSELNNALPGEATAPALCGTLFPTQRASTAGTVYVASIHLVRIASAGAWASDYWLLCHPGATVADDPYLRRSSSGVAS